MKTIAMIAATCALAALTGCQKTPEAAPAVAPRYTVQVESVSILGKPVPTYHVTDHKEGRLYSYMPRPKDPKPTLYQTIDLSSVGQKVLVVTPAPEPEGQ